ncbi:MAG: site-specific integrase [Cytophagales bacterium]|nr:site-specific integrase [Cytophagales bacterium]
MNTLDFYNKKLTQLNYSQRTIKQYRWFVDKYIREIRKSPAHLTLKDLDHYLVNQKWSSVSQQNQMINALKLFYKYSLNKTDLHLSKIERPRKEKKLPKVLDASFLVHKISKIENLKHKAILSLCFSVGLRVSEIINLKIEHIDSHRMRIMIKASKGKKDREAPLTENILKLLREYYKTYRPEEYLFNGQFKTQYSTNSCQKIFKKYISEKHSIHSLRHSCFSELASKGVNLKHIQDLAGHTSSKTTEIYLHTDNHLNKLPLAI